MSQPTVTAAPRRAVAHPVDEVLPPGGLAIYGFQHVLAFYAGAAALIEVAKIANHRFDDLVAEANPIASARTRRFEQLGS
jgi:hypothetical protein